MGLFLIILLIAAILAGSLWAVLKIALGIALGLFLFVAGLGFAIFWYGRRRFREAQRDLERHHRDRYV